MLETDAPYLAPNPHKTARNEPAFLPYIAAKIAEIKQVSVDEVIEITSANAKILFAL